jgi:hypothetical protein
VAEELGPGAEPQEGVEEPRVRQVDLGRTDLALAQVLEPGDELSDDQGAGEGVKDKYGLSWQVVPAVLPELVGDAGSEKSQRAMSAPALRAARTDPAEALGTD